MSEEQSRKRLKSNRGKLKQENRSLKEDKSILNISDSSSLFNHDAKEGSIEANENTIEKILSSSPNSITVTDLEGKIIECNQATVEMHAYSSKNDIIGKNALDLLAESEHNKAKRNTQKTLEEGAVENIEYKLIKKDGSKFPGELSASVVQNTAGEPIGFVAITKDISDRKKAEQEKEKLRKQLYQKQKLESIGTLTGGISHDFKNILTVIMGMSDLALDQVDNSNPIHSYLENILDSAEKGADLINQLLLFSQQKDTNFEILNLNEVIKDIDSILNRLTNEKIEINTNLKEGIWNINGDHDKLNQVLINLIVNARDAICDDGKITIRTNNIVLDKTDSKITENHNTGKYLLLEVDDNGHGMEQKIQNKIFDPFYTTKARSEGTGMGLSVVYGIVQSHEGIINVDSDPEEGTNIQIYFPAVENKIALQSEDANRSSSAQYLGNEETILIAEDEESVQKSIKNILADYNYNFYSASNGKEALELFKQHNGEIDLLLTDVVMPDIGGFELAETLESKKEDLKIIYISGYTEQNIENNIKGKDNKFIKKPYSSTELLKEIADLL